MEYIVVSDEIAPEVTTLLDTTAEQLKGSVLEAASVVRSLSQRLRDVKLGSTSEAWETVVAKSRAHPLRELLHQDPLSARAFNKPRGYQGDAQLMDVIYSKDYREVHPDEPSALGKAIFAYTIECKAPSAVRTRRKILAKLIDDAAEEINRPDVLSVACGHLREVQLSTAVQGGKVGRFVGLDQDASSLAVIEKDFREVGVEVVQGSIKLLLGGPFAAQRFDLIYAAGLYDYLEDRLAQHLTERMFEMLKPGGRLLVANYLPNIEDVGYMETYMGWSLIYRDSETLSGFGNAITAAQLGQSRTFTDIDEQVVYLEIRKR